MSMSMTCNFMLKSFYAFINQLKPTLWTNKFEFKMKILHAMREDLNVRFNLMEWFKLSSQQVSMLFWRIFLSEFFVKTSYVDSQIIWHEYIVCNLFNNTLRNILYTLFDNKLFSYQKKREKK